jgi:hypothetical protein
MHAEMQSMNDRQSGSLPHAWSWLQQLPATHVSHAAIPVESGSEVHVGVVTVTSCVDPVSGVDASYWGPTYVSACCPESFGEKGPESVFSFSTPIP